MANTNAQASEIEAALAEPQASSGMSKGLKLGIIVGGFLVIAVGAFFVVKQVIWPKYQEYLVTKQLTSEDGGAGEPVKQEVKEIGQVHVIKDLTVNTSGSNGMRFAVAEYVVEASDKKVIEEVKKREPQLRDVMIKYLRKHSANEILDLDFQEKSKNDLIALINMQLNSGKIDSMYYTKLIVQ